MLYRIFGVALILTQAFSPVFAEEVPLEKLIVDFKKGIYPENLKDKERLLEKLKTDKENDRQLEAKEIAEHDKDQEQLLKVIKSDSHNETHLKLWDSLEKELLNEGYKEEARTMRRYSDGKFTDLNFEELVRDVAKGRVGYLNPIEVHYLQTFKNSSEEKIVIISSPLRVFLDRINSQNPEEVFNPEKVFIYAEIPEIQVRPHSLRHGGPKGASSSSGGRK